MLALKQHTNRDTAVVGTQKTAQHTQPKQLTCSVSGVDRGIPCSTAINMTTLINEIQSYLLCTVLHEALWPCQWRHLGNPRMHSSSELTHYKPLWSATEVYDYSRATPNSVCSYFAIGCRIYHMVYVMPCLGVSML